MRREPNWPLAALEGYVAGISKSETLNRLSEKTGLTKKQVGQFLDELAALAYKEARSGFTIPGVGKLVIVDRKARMGRNPATGQPISIPAKRVLKFRIAKQAKDSVLAKRAK
jgi:DNA-binding protein HU-beta